MLTSGQVLAERYMLAGRIAVGGMGEVWEANDTRLDRTVAVKVLKAELSGDAEFLHRFRTEARTTASLNHPGIAGVHDYGETVEPSESGEGGSADAQHVAYLVMELVRGEPLAGILAREGRLAPERTLDLLEQAAHALQAAHENGLVHRDVKPGNILVTQSGHVKITDFGVAKAADAAPVTRSGMVMGTAHYIAPEQALGHDAEPASDVYSLAVCGYECLSGYRPFRSENAVTVAMMHIRDMPPPLPADVAPGARSLIEATLVKDPRQRYRNGGEFANAVAAVRAGLPLPAPVTTYGSAVGPRPTHVMNPTGPGSHPAMQPVAPAQAGPTSGPVGANSQQARPRSGNTALWVTLAVLVVLLVLAAALLLPKLFAGSPADDAGDPSGGSEFGVTDTSRSGEQDHSALPPERRSTVSSPPARPGSSAAETTEGSTETSSQTSGAESTTRTTGLPLGAVPMNAGERSDRHGPGARSPGNDR